MEKCEQQGYKKVLSISKHGFITSLHCLSAGAVCFARALNDTPKIVALMFVVMPLSVTFPSVLVALGMAFGGLLHSRKLAETLGKRIVKMNETEGVSANIVTSLLVIFASRFGLPVSTTHVSVGALVGVGLVSGKVDSKVFSSIFLSWDLTLPIAAFLSGLVYSIFR
jgi:PiT family inorganic phosphate transporter